MGLRPLNFSDTSYNVAPLKGYVSTLGNAPDRSF